MNTGLSTLQGRFDAKDPRFVSADRDIAYCFQDVFKLTIQRLAYGRWPSLEAILKRHNVSDADTAEAIKAFLSFMGKATEDRREDMASVLERSGWFDIPVMAQVALMACMGNVISGYFFQAARDTAIGGNGATANIEQLQKAGDRMARLMMMPRWRRPFWRARQRLKRVWNAIFTKVD